MSLLDAAVLPMKKVSPRWQKNIGRGAAAGQNCQAILMFSAKDDFLGLLMITMKATSRIIPALAVTLAVTLALAGCAVTPTVRTEAAQDIDFSTFRTFSFVAPLSTDRAGFHSLVSQQLMFSTRRELEVRGLEFVPDPDGADMLVNFHAHVAEQLRVRSTPDPWVGTSYWNHRSGRYQPWRGHTRWPGHSRLEVDQISEGRLSVDLVDRRQNRLIWEGVAGQRLTQRTMSDLGPAMDDAIHLIFAEFPVEPTL